MPFLRRLYFPLLLLLIALYTFYPLAGGDDFWAHAAIGRIFLDTGHVPKRTVYLWSADVPWVFHAWGSGVLFAFLLKLGGAKVGPWLCLTLNFLLAAIPLALIWGRAKRLAGEVPSVVVVAFVFVINFAEIRWHLRPELFTVCFLILTVLFLTTPRRPTWMFLAVVGMFALWPNMHGGVLLGILSLWIGALAHLYDRKFDSPSAVHSLPTDGESLGSEEAVLPSGGNAEPMWKLPLLALVCSIVPLVCNPWGPSYIRVFAGTEATAKHISEWRPFWVFPHMSREAAWGLCALWVVSFGIWLLDKRRRGAVLGLLLLTGALWLQARRQLWVTSAMCAFALAQSAGVLAGDALYSRLKRRAARLDAPMKSIAGVGTLFVLVAACVQAAPGKKLRAVDPTAPVAMSEFLAKRAPQGRIYNDYEYSAGLEWFLRGRRALYIDLINAYPPGLFDEWFEIAHASPVGLKVLDRKRIDLIAIRPVSPKDTDDPIFGLWGYVQKSRDWKLIYSGRDGHVWARRKPLARPGD